MQLVMTEFVTYINNMSVESKAYISCCACETCKFLCCSRSCFGNINFFGGPSLTSVKASTKLHQLESSNDDAMFVFLSDVWLDDIKVHMLIHLLLLSCSTYAV